MQAAACRDLSCVPTGRANVRRVSRIAQRSANTAKNLLPCTLGDERRSSQEKRAGSGADKCNENTACSCLCAPSRMELDATKCRKATIYWRHNAGYKCCCRTNQPEQRPRQIIGRAQPTHRGVRQNRLGTRRRPAGLGIQQQIAILLGQEKARSQRVHPNAWAVLLRYIYGQPLSKIRQRGLGPAIKYTVASGMP